MCIAYEKSCLVFRRPSLSILQKSEKLKDLAGPTADTHATEEKKQWSFPYAVCIAYEKSCLVFRGVYMATGKHIAFAHAADMDVPSAAALGTSKSFSSSEI